MAYNQPMPGQGGQRGTIRRLGVFLLGVGIGFVLLGLFRMARQAPPPPPAWDGSGAPASPGEANAEPAPEPTAGSSGGDGASP